MSLTIEGGGGATPLDPDEVEGLLPSHITTLRELNEWEQYNIVRAAIWMESSPPEKVVTPEYIRELHHKMFDQTWSWAGTYRTTNKNIGVDWDRVPVEVHELCENINYWFENGVYGTQESAARLHWRLAHVHPFPNGNGRHARLMADAILRREGQGGFGWGEGDLTQQGDVREQYIQALRNADDQDFDPLFSFLGIAL